MRVNKLLIGLMLVLPASAALGQTYVGDTTCQMCHQNFPTTGFFDGYMNSGHPWKIFHTAGNDPAPDTWPHTPVPPLPIVYDVQLVWSDVEYVIGNFYWKARFIDRSGYIYTGDVDETTQWNLLTQEWVPYHAGDINKPFDCGKCHTTGYQPTGHQLGLPGLIGTWEEDGVRCEACHGPGSDHASDPSNVPPPGGKDCSECHFRDSQFRMPWKGGFMRHHQQAEDFSHSTHKNALQCTSCHNPHRSVVYDDGGTTITCSQCHPGDSNNNFYTVGSGMEGNECTDCHMPAMGKSGQTFNEYKGDVHGHIFRIMTDPIAAVDNVYDDGTGSLFWNQDVNGDSFITLDYACLGCHIDNGTPLTLQEASDFATGIHSPPCAPDWNGDTTLNSQDFIAFLNDFVAGNADYNGDTTTNSQDFIAFLNDFVAGC